MADEYMPVTLDIDEDMEISFHTDDVMTADLGEIASGAVFAIKANYNQTNQEAIDYIIGRENIVGKEDLASVTEEILAEAKASGEFDGADGKDGANGKDGMSPTLSISAINGGHRIEVYDAIGIRTFVVKDGQDGADGRDGTNGKDGANGKDGVNGKDGKDGVSVTHSWSGTTLFVTSASGTTSANLKGAKGDTGAQGAQGAQGIQGEKGADGYTPVRGTDYFTDADKAEMVSAVLAALPVYDGSVTIV